MGQLVKVTVKQNSNTNRITIKKGMSVEYVSKYGISTISTNLGHEVIDAFQRKYGIDIKKGGYVSSVYLNVEVIN